MTVASGGVHDGVHASWWWGLPVPPPLSTSTAPHPPVSAIQLRRVIVISRMTSCTDHRERDRKDHYLPRGFLKGFIDPANKDLAKPLWHFDLETAEWSRESPGSIGWERGMYDYHPGTNVLEHPDKVFERFEREFPLVREHLLRRNFKGWVKQHKHFLLEYAQMMRARSPLFLQQQTKQKREHRAL